jgi:carbonic anhydrase
MVPSLVTPHDAVKRLEDGNARFAAGLRSVDSLASGKRLAELAKHGQTPFAAFLACADSRAPTEAIFDCGLGELFVTRVAGNVVSPHMVASLEYGAIHLGTSLIVVMGHTGCGAVKAAVAASGAKKSDLTHSLQMLVDDMKPAVVSSKKLEGVSAKSLIKTVERENVRLNCRALLERSETLAGLVKERRVQIVGALFHMDTGRVEFGLETAAG